MTDWKPIDADKLKAWFETYRETDRQSGWPRSSILTLYRFLLQYQLHGINQAISDTRRRVDQVRAEWESRSDLVFLPPAIQRRLFSYGIGCVADLVGRPRAFYVELLGERQTHILTRLLLTRGIVLFDKVPT
jgi:hypothetical protein